MVNINRTISITTLNVDSLNTPMKTQRLSELIKKQDPTICCLSETHIKYKYTHRKKKEMEKDITVLNVTVIKRK